MAVPFKYNRRSLLVRRVSTAMTVAGIALVVSVFLLVRSLAEGVSRTFATTVSRRGVVAIRVGSQSDAYSIIDREEIQSVFTLPGIERDGEGRPLISPEIVVLVNLVRKDGGHANVIVRGVEVAAFALRPALRIVEGRRFRPGTNEVVVSRLTQARFQGLGVGSTIRSGSERWAVVGAFEAGSSPYDSEIWADLHDLQTQSQRDGIVSAVRLRATDEAAREALITAIRSDQRIKLEAKTEEQYFREQMSVAEPIEFLAYFVGAIMAIGAAFGAMNTMYAQVAARTREVATMRALGYRRRSILASFVLESLTLGLCGGVLGAVLALALVKVVLTAPTGTQNLATFSEVLFNFELTPALLGWGIAFAGMIGVLGGLLPALRAARLPLTASLREA